MSASIPHKIYSNKEVEIGSHVRIGWECQVLDSDCHLVYNSETREIKSPMAKVTIGDNVWLCARTSIMKGADIPPYSIIAANSLVNKPFRDITPPMEGNVFAGNPARLVATGRYRLLDEEYEHRMKRHFQNSDGIDRIKVGEDFNFRDYLTH